MDRHRKRIAAVVDTNVVAYYLLGTPHFATETQEFWHRAGEVFAPALWEAEIANVLWMAVRAGVLVPEEAPEKLGLAGRLSVHSISNRTLWHGALMRSIASGVAVYDALFVELADRESLYLATFDEKVIKAFPSLARRPGDFL